MGLCRMGALVHRASRVGRGQPAEGEQPGTGRAPGCGRAGMRRRVALAQPAACGLRRRQTPPRGRRPGASRCGLRGSSAEGRREAASAGRQPSTGRVSTAQPSARIRPCRSGRPRAGQLAAAPHLARTVEDPGARVGGQEAQHHVGAWACWDGGGVAQQRALRGAAARGRGWGEGALHGGPRRRAAQARARSQPAAPAGLGHRPGRHHGCLPACLPTRADTQGQQPRDSRRVAGRTSRRSPGRAP